MTPIQKLQMVDLTNVLKECLELICHLTCATIFAVERAQSWPKIRSKWLHCQKCNYCTIICNKVEEYNVNEQWICLLLTGSYFKPSDATMVSARSRTSAPMSAFKQTTNLNILWHDRFLTCISYYTYIGISWPLWCQHWSSVYYTWKAERSF